MVSPSAIGTLLLGNWFSKDPLTCPSKKIFADKQIAVNFRGHLKSLPQTLNIVPGWMSSHPSPGDVGDGVPGHHGSVGGWVLARQVRHQEPAVTPAHQHHLRRGQLRQRGHRGASGLVTVLHVRVAHLVRAAI